jgi:hypothetical protein
LEVFEYDPTSPDSLWDNPLSPINKSMMNTPSSVQELNDFVENPVDKELVIKVTDPFNREFFAEYHGQTESIFQLKFFGNVVEVREDGIRKIMVGDKRGVEFKYSAEFYLVTIYVYRDGDDIGEEAVYGDEMATVNGIASHTFLPTEYGDALFQIIAYGNLSKAIIFNEFFQFNTQLPDITFTTFDDIPLGKDINQVFDGTIMNIDRSASPFGGSVSFVRTFDGVVDRFTLPDTVDSYKLTNPGFYKITVRNSLWAEQTYEMEIIQSESSVLKVYDDIGGTVVQLTASPVPYMLSPGKDYPYITQTQQIKHYIYSIAGNDPTSEKPQVDVPPTNYRQIIGRKVGNYYTKNDYFFIPQNSNVLIWCLAVPIYEGENIVDFASPIYFATTGVRENTPITTTNVGINLWAIVDNPTGTERPLNSNPSERYRLYTPTEVLNSEGASTQTEFPKNGIRIGMKYQTQIPYNPSVTQSAGGANVLYMDYYKDGVYMGRIEGDAQLTLMREDAGSYDFYVYDMVGNNAVFNGSDHYTLINLFSRPFVVINNATPVNGAVYNDSVNFYVTDVPYALDLFPQTYEKYFYISNMTVLLDSVELEKFSIPVADEETGITPMLEEKKHNKNRFTFGQRGKYEVNIKYRIGASVFVQSTYIFQIVPSALPMENFEYTISSNIDISRITRNGYNITNNYDLSVGSKIAFSVADGVGEYAVYGETKADEVNKAVPQSFKVTIDRKYTSSSIRVEGVGSGASTNTPVTVSYYAYYLYMDGLKREVTIVIYMDGVIIKDFPVVIGEETIAALRTQEKDTPNLNYQNTQTVVPLTEEGRYVVAVFDADNDVIYSYAFALVGVESNRGVVVGIILGGVVLIVIFLFIRIRSKMKVK